jgi:predicted aconitase
MRLSAHGQAMLDGAEGPAAQTAMDLLARYGESLGAEKLVDTNNVCATGGACLERRRKLGYHSVHNNRRR